MSSIQAVLRRKANSAGLFPLAIRLTKNRKASYLYIGQYIDEKYWDKVSRKVRKSHPNSTRLNNLLIKKLAEANNKLLEVDDMPENQSAMKIKRKIVGGDKMDFFALSEIYLTNLQKRKKIGLYNTQKGRINIFKKFLGEEKIFLNDLDVGKLRKFEQYLEFEREVSKRTIVNYYILIRTIMNLGIKEFGLVAKNYPFGKNKIQIRVPESEKIGLSILEVKKLENAKGLTPAQQLAVHTWLLSFYFAGMRLEDVLTLKWSDFKDGRLYYRMGKNEKLVSLTIPEKAKLILDSFLNDGKDSDLVLPYLDISELKNSEVFNRRKNTVNRTINRRLESVAKKLNIDKKLSMHIARHSFGNISGDKIPIQMLQKLYRHSSITTTVNYQANFMHRETDEALEKVVGF